MLYNDTLTVREMVQTLANELDGDILEQLLSTMKGKLSHNPVLF